MAHHLNLDHRAAHVVLDCVLGMSHGAGRGLVKGGFAALNVGDVHVNGVHDVINSLAVICGVVVVQNLHFERGRS